MGQRGRDGCWGVGLPAGPAERLARLGERCARGFSALIEPRAVEVGAEGVSEVALPALPSGACLRAAAVGPGGVELTLSGDDGAQAQVDADPAFSLLSPSGPICPRKREGLSLKLRRKGGSGAVWVQAWSSVAR